MKKSILFACLIVLSTFAFAQGTAFTYQGRLDDGVNPAAGIYDLRFTIYDSASAGSVVGGPVTNSLTSVSNGLFTVTLDFGASVFTGANRWLEIAVRTNGGSAYATLSPRQPLASTPYAVRASNAATAASVSGSVAASQLTGTILPANIAPASITGAMLATGSVASAHLTAGSVTTANLANGAVTSSKIQTLFNAPLEYTVFDLNSSFNSGFQHEFGYNVLWIPNANGYVITDPFTELPGSTDRGTVYLLLNGSTLTINSPFSLNNGRFGESVADTGAGLLVGAPGEGNVYSVAYNGATSLSYSGSSLSQFGKSVARTGNGITLIGAPLSDGGQGQVRMYNTLSPILVAPLSVPRFGQAMVSVGANQVVIGARGLAFLYSVTGTGAAHLATLGVPGGLGLFGESLAALGSDRFLVGGLGPVGLFSTNGTLLTTFVHPENGPGSDAFGVAVAALGTDKIAVSAPGRVVDGKTNAGVVYIFNTNGLWIGISRNPEPSTDAYFGTKLIGLGDDLFAASTLERSGGDRRGAVRWCRLKTDYKFLAGLSLDPGQQLPDLGMAGASTLEFGAGNNKETNAGKIGYQAFSDGLDIVGAGTNGATRKVHIYSEGGATIEGNLTVNGTLSAAGLNASQLTSGTVADARLSSNVALRSGGNTFSGTQIVTNGNVGIGTNNPTVPLQVVGAATWPGGPPRGAITGTQTAGDAFSAGVAGVSLVPGAYGVVGVSDMVLVGASGPGAANIGVGGNSSTTNGTGVYGYAGADSGLTFGVVGEAPSAQGYGGYFLGRGYFSGNVGIGNSAPSRFLHIGGPPGTEGMIRLHSASTNGLAHRTWDIGVPKDDVSVAGKFYSFVIDDVLLGTDPEFLIQYFTGNVGIGTTNPLAKLDVNGSVRATSFAGNAGSLTNLNASQLNSGTVPLARLPAGLLTNGASGVNLSGTFSGDGAGLTNLNASQLTSGSLADARLSTNVALLNRTNQSFSGNNTFNQLGVQGTNPLEFGVGDPNRDPFEASIAYNYNSGGSGGLASSSLDIAGARVLGGDPRIVRIFDSLVVGNLLFVGGQTSNVGVKRVALSNAFEVEGNASKTTAGSWLANSDARIKQDIRPIEGALEKLNQVNLVSFRYTDQYRKDHPSVGDQRYLNVVAQEFANVFPDHVQASGEKLPDGSKILQVDTYPLTIYSAAAVQELNRRLEKKDAEIANLQARLEKLEQLLGDRLNGGNR